MALHGGGELALPFRGGLLVVLASAQLGEEASLLNGALEAAHGHFEGLVFLDAYGRHAVFSRLRFTEKGRILPEVPQFPPCWCWAWKPPATRPDWPSMTGPAGACSPMRCTPRWPCTRPMAGWCPNSHRATTCADWCP